MSEKRTFQQLRLQALPLEVHPSSKHQQDNRDDPEGRTAHFCFLGHEPHFKPDIAFMRGPRVVSCVVVVNRLLLHLFWAHLLQRLSRRRSRGPGPLKIEAAEMAGNVYYFADEE